jgi:hypothetical protein
MVIPDRTKRTGKSNTTMDFENFNVMVWSGFSWLNLASWGARFVKTKENPGSHIWLGIDHADLLPAPE